ncbi:hypothetical protein Glove_50g54 [Diversispora epigaea]|uniref:Uncharacterized protein n=1 Tax=Diversispora epigaea TaxID=1348612 RepID=A0A397JKG0_9GLOM|nr:hypothetical protein Glove_50g54 [Diversispora epigaea]
MYELKKINAIGVSIYLWATVNLEKVGIASEISSWKEESSVACYVDFSEYEFNLILHASRDGFEKDASWNLCDHKTNVIVEKVKDTDDIIGGYPIYPIFCN